MNAGAPKGREGPTSGRDVPGASSPIEQAVREEYFRAPKVPRSAAGSQSTTGAAAASMGSAPCRTSSAGSGTTAIAPTVITTSAASATSASTSTLATATALAATALLSPLPDAAPPPSTDPPPPLPRAASATSLAPLAATPTAGSAVAAARPPAGSRPPKFASLELSVIDPNRDPAGAAAEPFAANARAPIPLETAYFSGHVLLLVRPESLAVRRTPPRSAL